MVVTRTFILLTLIVCITLLSDSFCMKIIREEDSPEENDKINDLDIVRENSKTSEKSRDGEDDGNPSNAADEEEPSGEEGEKPSDGEDDDKPSDGGDDDKPSDGGEDDEPSDGEDDKPSDHGDDDQPLYLGNNEKPPSDAGDKEKSLDDKDDQSEKDSGKNDDVLKDDTLLVKEDAGLELSTTTTESKMLTTNDSISTMTKILTTNDSISTTTVGKMLTINNSILTTTTDSEMPTVNDSSKPSTTNHDKATTTDLGMVIDDDDYIDELLFEGGFTFFSPFFSFEQVEEYFRKLERDMQNIFKQAMDEVGTNNTNFRNSSDQIIEIDGQKYKVHTTIIKGGDTNSSIEIEAISAVPIDKRRKRRSLW